jgi:hypothetical protein
MSTHEDYEDIFPHEETPYEEEISPLSSEHEDFLRDQRYHEEQENAAKEISDEDYAEKYFNTQIPEE